MYKYGKTSKDRLATCDHRLRIIFEEAIKIMDIAILEGHRNKETQNKAYEDGNSKLQWPDSSHNSLPSRAVDAAPYPIDWNNRERFFMMAGLVIAIGHSKGKKIRWGGDWNMDGETTDNGFDDLVHFEIVEG